MNQYLNQEGDNFYKLNLLILNNVRDCKDDIIDNLKFVFVKHDLIKCSDDLNIDEENISENDGEL